MTEMIYDRTSADVAVVKALKRKIIANTATADERAMFCGAVSLRGDYRAVDLNRIERACDEVKELLSGAGYSLDIETKTWAGYQYVTVSELNRIRHNVDAIADAFTKFSDWKEITYKNTHDYTQANALEWDIYRAYQYITEMLNSTNLRQANTITMQAGGMFNA